MSEIQKNFLVAEAIVEDMVSGWAPQVAKRLPMCNSETPPKRQRTEQDNQILEKEWQQEQDDEDFEDFVFG